MDLTLMRATVSVILCVDVYSYLLYHYCTILSVIDGCM